MKKKYSLLIINNYSYSNNHFTDQNMPCNRVKYFSSWISARWNIFRSIEYSFVHISFNSNNSNTLEKYHIVIKLEIPIVFLINNICFRLNVFRWFLGELYRITEFNAPNWNFEPHLIFSNYKHLDVPR